MLGTAIERAVPGYLVVQLDPPLPGLALQLVHALFDHADQALYAKHGSHLVSSVSQQRLDLLRSRKVGDKAGAWFALWGYCAIAEQLLDLFRRTCKPGRVVCGIVADRRIARDECGKQEATRRQDAPRLCQRAPSAVRIKQVIERPHHQYGAKSTLCIAREVGCRALVIGRDLDSGFGSPSARQPQILRGEVEQRDLVAHTSQIDRVPAWAAPAVEDV